MQYKTTNKEQRENNTLVIGFNYGAIQYVERYLAPNAYTTGVYAWRADFYNFNGFTLSTGYNPLSFVRYKNWKKRAEYIKQEIIKLDNKLGKFAYKFQRGGDWHKGNKFVVKKINDIYKQSEELIK